MEKQTCQTCKHFRQHYVKLRTIYSKTPSGHCVYPRSKLRRWETSACENYKENPRPQAEAEN